MDEDGAQRAHSLGREVLEVEPSGNTLREVPGKTNVLTLLTDQLTSTISAGAHEAFRAYLRNGPTDRYIIASDYCVGDTTFRNDSLVFTVIKGGEALPTVLDLATRLTGDLKQRTPTDDEIAFLRDPRFFTFGLIQSGRARLLTRDQAVDSIQHTLELISSWQNADTHDAIIGRLRQLREQARGKGSSAPSFFVRMLVASTIAAWIATLIARQQPLNAVGWFSDRDNITTHSDGLVKHLFGASLNDQCIAAGCAFPPIYGFNEEDPNASPDGPPWYDPYVRIPDHFAGPLADLNLGSEPGTPVHPRSEKYRTVFTGAIADNPQIAIVRTDGDRWPWAFSSVTLSRNPPTID